MAEGSKQNLWGVELRWSCHLYHAAPYNINSPPSPCLPHPRTHPPPQAHSVFCPLAVGATIEQWSTTAELARLQHQQCVVIVNVVVYIISPWNEKNQKVFAKSLFTNVSQIGDYEAFIVWKTVSKKSETTLFSLWQQQFEEIKELPAIIIVI